jgi:hypothetical protein
MLSFYNNVHSLLLKYENQSCRKLESYNLDELTTQFKNIMFSTANQNIDKKYLNIDLLRLDINTFVDSCFSNVLIETELTNCPFEYETMITEKINTLIDKSFGYKIIYNSDMLFEWFIASFMNMHMVKSVKK